MGAGGEAGVDPDEGFERRGGLGREVRDGAEEFFGEGDGGGVGSVLQESDAVGVRVADGGRGGADGAVRGGGQAGGVPSVLRRGGGGTGELQEAGGRELAGQRGVAVVSGAVRGFAGKANRAV